MKVGILSYQQVRNYGAVLQNYALQTFLNSLPNIESETIDYRCEYLDKGYNRRMLHEGQRGILNYTIKDAVKYVMVLPLFKKREKIFETYLSSHIKRSNKVYYRDDIAYCKNDYDFFVVGSDQVWNLEIIHDDLTYFLDFVDDQNKKVSYAASICWKYVHDCNSGLIVNMLSEFGGISVREKKDAEVLKKLSLKNVNVNIDPTLLLSLNQWEKAEEIIKKPERYILFFELLDAGVAASLAKEKSKALDIPVVYISSDDKPWKYKEFLHIHNVNPGQFLDLVKNAEEIYTNSFHGVIFALLYHKDFYCQQMNNDRRMEDALQLIGLTNYCSKDNYGIRIQNSDQNTWNDFEKGVDIQRAISKKYLLYHLERV